jgi:hypothetical protein
VWSAGVDFDGLGLVFLHGHDFSPNYGGLPPLGKPACRSIARNRAKYAKDPSPHHVAQRAQVM